MLRVSPWRNFISIAWPNTSTLGVPGNSAWQRLNLFLCRQYYLAQGTGNLGTYFSKHNSTLWGRVPGDSIGMLATGLVHISQLMQLVRQGEQASSSAFGRLAFLSLGWTAFGKSSSVLPWHIRRDHKAHFIYLKWILVTLGNNFHSHVCINTYMLTYPKV